MKTLRMFSIAVLLCVVPLSMVQAQRAAGSYSLGAFGGIGLPMGGEFFKDYYKMGIGFGAEFKFNFTEKSSLGASFTYQPFKFDSDPFIDFLSDLMMVPGLTIELDGGDVNTSIFSANYFQYFTPPDASLSFYLTAGGGYYSFSTTDMSIVMKVSGQTLVDETEQGESESGFGINGGLGIEFLMGTKMYIFAEGKYHYTFVEIEGDEDLEIEDTKLSFVTVKGGIRFIL